MTNFIRVPSISKDAFDQEQMTSLTEVYLSQNEDALNLASELLQKLAQHDDLEETLNEISKMIEDFDDSDILSFFDEQNLARYVLETKSNTGMDLTDIEQELTKRFPIFIVIDADHEVMQERITRQTQLCFGELYPLYCTPKDDVIRHFIEHCGEVGFMEIGDGNYFAYLTSSGMLFNKQIAYAYLMVDDCVPSNIMSHNDSVSELNDVMRKAFEEHFNA
tara:strand:- start:4030 stop:4689 length:660 start_codon:yes stop_codon:yes gene_type:complete